MTNTDSISPVDGNGDNSGPGSAGSDCWKFWLGVFGITVLFFALRWNNFNAPLIRDEGEYGYAAQVLSQGMEPYQDAFIQKPPMVVYSYALAHLICPQCFWAPRLLAGAFAALATFFLGLIARMEFGPRFSWPSMWLMTPMILLPGIEQFPANTEMFLLFPLLATVAVYSYSRRFGIQPAHWMASGLLAVATLCYKYTALPIFVLLFVVWSLETWFAARKPGFLLRCWVSALLGAMVAALIILGFFLVPDGGRQLWECTVRFNRYYAASNNFSPGLMASRLKGFWSAWWILFLLLPALVLYRNWRIIFWIAMWVCALISTGGSNFGHYYILAMPFWAMLSAVAILSLSRHLAKWLSRPAGWIGIASAAVVLLFVLLPDFPWMLESPAEFVTGRLGARSPFMASPVVARRVAQLSLPKDFVLVAGSEPQILVYSHRFSPTRFITAYALVIPSPMTAIYQDEAIHDLQERPPALIVMAHSWLQEVSPTPPYLVFLNQLLSEHYDRVGGYAFDGPKGYWSEPLSDEAAPAAAMVLYKRRDL